MLRILPDRSGSAYISCHAQMTSSSVAASGRLILPERRLDLLKNTVDREGSGARLTGAAPNGCPSWIERPDRIAGDRNQVRNRVGMTHVGQVFDGGPAILIRTGLSITGPPDQTVHDLTNTVAEVGACELGFLGRFALAHFDRDGPPETAVRLRPGSNRSECCRATAQPLELRERRGDDQRLGPVAQATEPAERGGQLVHDGFAEGRFRQVARREMLNGRVWKI